MAPPTWSQTIDQLFATTWMKRRKSAIQQAFLKTPLAYWLREKGRVENMAGYTRLEIPVEYGSNDTVVWIGKGSTVNLNDNELITMAYDDWKYVAVNITRYMTDDQKNRGKAAAIKLVERKIKAAERALYEEFERAFFADGTGTNEPNGLQNLISTAPTTGTVHGLNRATYSWWRNQATTSSGVSSAYLLTDMRNALNDCTRYKDAEKEDYIIMTDQTNFERYEDEVIEQKVIHSPGGKGSKGDPMFDIVSFKGRPLMWSPSAPSNEMRFINTNNLKLVVDESYWMDMTDWKQIPDQVNDKVAQILCTCNLVGDRFITHHVLSGLT